MASISTMCIHHWPLIQLSWSHSYFRWHFCNVQFHIIRSHLSIGICCILPWKCIWWDHMHLLKFFLLVSSITLAIYSYNIHPST
jgi:hypothetical protein